MSEAVLKGFIEQSPPKRLLKRGTISEFQRSEHKGYDWMYRREDGVWEDVSTDRLLDLCYPAYLREIIYKFAGA